MHKKFELVMQWEYFFIDTEQLQNMDKIFSIKYSLHQ